MKSVATKRFWACFNTLPESVQRQARRAYALWLADPSHRSLEFKQVHSTRAIFSVRVGLHWRAIATRDADTVIWVWIGSHADDDKLLTRL